METVTVSVPDAPAGHRLLAPVGIAMPEAGVADVGVANGVIERIVAEPTLRLNAAVVRARGGPLHITCEVSPALAAPVPAEAFALRDTPYTRAADELAGHAREMAAAAGGGRAGIDALVADAASRFTYGHPERRFNDGCSAVPLVACGGTEGSCVDINAYLVASLRAAGYEAAYIAGYFFPAEKGGATHDMHCWVVTRHDGEVLAWDIAHHKKMGATAVRPGLNPKPGTRVALTHSLGHTYPAAAPGLIKLLAEPLWLTESGLKPMETLAIQGRPARAAA